MNSADSTLADRPAPAPGHRRDLRLPQPQATARSRSTPALAGPILPREDRRGRPDAMTRARPRSQPAEKPSAARRRASRRLSLACGRCSPRPASRSWRCRCSPRPRLRASSCCGMVKAAALIAVSSILFRRRRREPVAALLAIAFLLWTISSSVDFTVASGSWPAVLDRFRFLFFAFAMLLFPNGEWRPRWARQVAAATVAVFLLGLAEALGDRCRRGCSCRWRSAACSRPC